MTMPRILGSDKRGRKPQVIARRGIVGPPDPSATFGLEQQIDDQHDYEGSPDQRHKVQGRL